MGNPVGCRPADTLRMVFDTHSHGYAFTDDLCRAIELFTAAEVSKNARVFTYRGLDLRYAVERQLYITCINSAPLFDFYRSGIGADAKVWPVGLDAMSAQVARFLPSPPANGLARFSGRGRGYLALRWFYEKLKSRHRPADGRRTVSGNVRVLFHVTHPKFARYLAPVTRRLPAESYAYLISVDGDLEKAIQAAGEPTAVWPHGGGTLRAALVLGSLQEFRGLLEAVDVTLSAIKFLKPKSVVVVEGNAPIDSITSEVCKSLGIPCFCIQQGWSPYVHTGFRHMGFSEMFVWGPRFAEMLAPFNPGQRFLVTGSHSFDHASLSGDLPKSGRRTISFFLQAPCAFLCTQSYDAFVRLVADCAQAHPSIDFLVREHPGYPVPGTLRQSLAILKNVEFSDPTHQPLAEVVRRSELVVSVFSTVLLEALAFGVVPLVCSIGSLPKYEPDIAGSGAGMEVFSVEAAKNRIDAIIANPAILDPYRNAMKGVVEQYFAEREAVDLMVGRMLGSAAVPNQNAKP